MKLKLEQIAVDEELYPRNQCDWLTTYQYAEAMLAGAVFPPIVVGKKHGGYLLLDGRHRLEAANQCATRTPARDARKAGSGAAVARAWAFRSGGGEIAMDASEHDRATDDRTLAPEQCDEVALYREGSVEDGFFFGA